MTAIRCDVEPIGTRLLIRLSGELSVASAPRVRAALLKCLVEQPDAVVVDLAGTVLVEPAAATVFHAAAQHAARWPGTPLIFSTADPGLSRQLGRGLAVHASVDEALAAKPGRRNPVISDVLLPVSGAAQRARDLATCACARWRLPHLSGRAGLVAGELVTNAVVHAQTMLDLRLTLGRRYLVVAVRDGSSAPPVLPGPASADPLAPRGLLLVDAMSRRWGSTPAPGGKVVWAALAT
ncbi:STAS domain-containing protein [Actinoplanes sp. NPDC023714]|uniref:STAS domain-containing protein n=1 Tax=Actinoplanes sp. NPDC023714 TaxID=3154322 RepID=UPI0033BFB90C